MIPLIALTAIIYVEISIPKEDVAACLAERTAIFTSASVIQYKEHIKMTWGRGIPSLIITDARIEAQKKFGMTPLKMLKACASEPAERESNSRRK